MSATEALTTRRERAPRVRKRWTPSEIVVMVVLSALVLLVSTPVLYALANSFRSYSDITRDPMGLPTSFTFDNYVQLFQQTDFAEAVGNTLIITVATVMLLVAMVPMAAYGIERLGGRLGRGIYVLFIAGLMIPFQVRMIPLVEGFDDVGLYSTLTSVILVHLGGAASFGILLYCSFIKGIPVEVEEAAHMDGAGRLRTFWLIVFPMLLPVTSAFVIIQALGLWNDFFIPLVFLDSSSAGTINVAINRMVGLLTSQWQLIYTGAILAIIPSVAIFAAFQRYFIKGMSIGAVKG
ncbi:sugar ABC transporter permease [Microbacterium barkeri]|uniref:Sugar ABC transporter permease n=1 Tax=Microbacterium barkeri TaxID=33917 RepID=A0A9W6H2J6_9MICO|nr:MULTISPECIES: carbohydrate ABC transporter permease [Microbacterium]MDR6877269.1 raffinose/stachyose/melibiose transport system permease protein [Microbacterium barkeri]WRH16414.1 ABC transporter permease subunit [Microbacterium sp. JZ37]GLJ61176.1 sugar ABC transporter permease [Microbacterium barkeri]